MGVVALGSWSYGAAAVGYAVLAVLLLVAWRGKVAGALLLFAAVVSGSWAAVTAVVVGADVRWIGLSGLLELARSLSWYAFLVSLLAAELLVRNPDRARARAQLVRIAAWCVGLVVVATLLSVLDARRVLGADRLAPYLGGVGLAIGGLVLVEQAYRNSPRQHQWGLKFLALGLAALFAFDLVLYAEGMLFGRLDPDVWVARGFANALVVPLIAVAAARNPEWALDVAVSRRMVFHSAALFGAGVYLLVMAVAGYYVRLFGGSWGSVLQTTFFFAAALALALIVSSGTLRARLRVFLSKHFFSYRYDYREEWLRFTRALAEGDPAMRLEERTIEAIADLVESPAGVLWLRQESGRLERAAHWNWGELDGIEPGDGALARFLGERQWVVSVEEVRAEPARYGGLDLPAWLAASPQAWLVVPLILHEALLGFVVLARPRTEVTVNWEVHDLLKAAGRQAAGYLGQLAAAQALLVARQFESFNRMSAFVVHDLKNLVAQLSLLLANAEKHRHNPAFQDDVLETVGNVAERMRRMLMQLRAGTTPVEQPLPVDLETVVSRAVASRPGLEPSPQVEMRAPGLKALAHAERLERVVGHLVQNAVEATPVTGAVWVRLLREGSSAVIEVEDTGRGMSPDFVRERLFRPFESTKTSGMGIGAYESREYVRELGGRLDVDSREREGTRFRIVLPVVEARSEAVAA